MSDDETTRGNDHGEAGRDGAGADTSRQASKAPGDWDQGAGEMEYGLVGRMMYRASYGLAYVVVYPASLLARMVPRENALVHGLIDGAAAARDEAPKLGWSSTSPRFAGDQPAPAALPA